MQRTNVVELKPSKSQTKILEEMMLLSSSVYNMPITKDSTTIRIQLETKSQLEKLDFAKKNSFDEIITILISNYVRGRT